jgi:hypothetical protein
MKIIQVHNSYQQAGGGDAVVAAEFSLLRDRGRAVIAYCRDNGGIADSGSLLLDKWLLLQFSQ